MNKKMSDHIEKSFDFVLSLRIDGLEIDEPDGVPLARVGGLFVNFQLSSRSHFPT